MNKPPIDLRTIILKILSVSPKHGYSLVKEINKRLGWKPSLGGIYPILGDLEKDGLILGHEMVEFGRFKKVYKLTNKGIEEFKRLEREFKALKIFMESE
jgi:DNA-binding PadR family transcriptional regulator